MKKHVSIYITFVLLLFLSVNQSFAQQKKITPSLYENVNKEKMNQWVDSVFNTLDTDRKIGQLFTMMVSSNTSESSRKRLSSLIKEQHIGGILFHRGTIQDQAEMTNYAQSLAEVPLMVSLDGEWGLGMRIKNTTPWPKNMMLGAIQNDSLIYYYGLEVARQCNQLGIHINFAPTLDANSNPRNPVIGYRSFGEDPHRVAKLGIMYSKGLEAGGVMSVAKHFPGHGDTSTDSHHTLPVINHTRERLDIFEFLPFTSYINEKLSGIMVAHLDIPALDNSKQPSSLSKNIVTDLLQEEMGFTGLIFTDGMEMKGVANEPDHSVRAILAGNDVVLSPTHPAQEFKAVQKAVKEGRISQQMLDEKVKKILSYKYIFGATSKDAVTVNRKGLEQRLNTSYADWLTRKLNESAITLLKDNKELLPLNKLDKRKIAAVSIGSSADNAFLTSLKLYGNVATFSVKDGSQLVNLKKQLDEYDTIIIGVHNRDGSNNAGILKVIEGKEAVLAFFIYPYYLDSYQTSIQAADAVVLGYEDTELATDFTAQAIFGGRKFTGRTPVSIGSIYQSGSGIVKKKHVLDMEFPKK